MRPHQLALILTLVEAFSEPDAPSDIEISSHAGHEVPAESKSEEQRRNYKRD
jgi:hypothetical protein